jgi:hypothetical protein
MSQEVRFKKVFLERWDEEPDREPFNQHDRLNLRGIARIADKRLSIDWMPYDPDIWTPRLVFSESLGIYAERTQSITYIGLEVGHIALDVRGPTIDLVFELNEVAQLQLI